MEAVFSFITYYGPYLILGCYILYFFWCWSLPTKSFDVQEESPLAWEGQSRRGEVLEFKRTLIKGGSL